MAPTLARQTRDLSGENREDSSGSKREAGSNNHPGNGKADQRVSTRSRKMRLGSGVLFGKWPEISEPRSCKDGCDGQLCSLRTTRRHRLYHALELSALAVHQVRSTLADGWKHHSLQTLQHNTPVRTGPPERLRVNRVHSWMLQHRSWKRSGSQLPNRIGHHSCLIYRQCERGTNGSSSRE